MFNVPVNGRTCDNVRIYEYMTRTVRKSKDD